MSTLHPPHENHHEEASMLIKAEHFVIENRKSLAIIGGAIIGLALIFSYYQYMYIPGREKEAQDQMFKAESYFASEAYTAAIDGDGSYPGFKKIVEEYGNTKSGNLAQFYLGISYLKTGKYNDAIEHLTGFSGNDILLSAMALGATGDAYTELKNYDKAVVFYKKAVEKNRNAFTSPLYLKKLGLVYEQTKDFKSATEAYQTIESDFPESTEAQDIKTYIARAEVQAF